MTQAGFSIQGYINTLTSLTEKMELQNMLDENKKLKEKVKRLEYVNNLVFNDVERICNEKMELEIENKKLKEELAILREKYGDLDY